MGAEAKLKTAIHRRLPRELFKQGNGGMIAGNGTPDHYYDGRQSDLWVEWKAHESMPRNGIVSVAPIPDRKYRAGHLTALQYAWLKRRHLNGGNAVVICGLPGAKAVILWAPSQWDSGVNIAAALDYEETAQWITNFCMGTPKPT